MGTGMGLVVKTLSFHTGEPGFDSQLSVLASCQCKSWEAAGDGSNHWIPANYVGDLDWVLGSWLVVGIRGVHQLMRVLILSVSASQIKKNKLHKLKDHVVMSLIKIIYFSLPVLSQKKKKESTEIVELHRTYMIVKWTKKVSTYPESLPNSPSLWKLFLNSCNCTVLYQSFTVFLPLTYYMIYYLW